MSANILENFQLNQNSDFPKEVQTTIQQINTWLESPNSQLSLQVDDLLIGEFYKGEPCKVTHIKGPQQVQNKEDKLFWIVNLQNPKNPYHKQTLFLKNFDSGLFLCPKQGVFHKVAHGESTAEWDKPTYETLYPNTERFYNHTPKEIKTIGEIRTPLGSIYLSKDLEIHTEDRVTPFLEEVPAIKTKRVQDQVENLILQPNKEEILRVYQTTNREMESRIARYLSILYAMDQNAIRDGNFPKASKIRKRYNKTIEKRLSLQNPTYCYYAYNPPTKVILHEEDGIQTYLSEEGYLCYQYQGKQHLCHEVDPEEPKALEKAVKLTKSEIQNLLKKQKPKRQKKEKAAVPPPINPEEIPKRIESYTITLFGTQAQPHLQIRKGEETDNLGAVSQTGYRHATTQEESNPQTLKNHFEEAISKISKTKRTWLPKAKTQLQEILHKSAWEILSPHVLKLLQSLPGDKNFNYFTIYHTAHNTLHIREWVLFLKLVQKEAASLNPDLEHISKNQPEYIHTPGENTFHIKIKVARILNKIRKIKGKDPLDNNLNLAQKRKPEQKPKKAPKTQKEQLSLF